MNRAKLRVKLGYNEAKGTISKDFGLRPRPYIDLSLKSINPPSAESRESPAAPSLSVDIGGYLMTAGVNR